MTGRKALAIGLMCALLLVGCSKNDAPTTDNTVNIHAAFEMKSLDPSSSGYIYLRMQVLETLLNVNDDGQLVPALASAWQISDDAKTWTLTLRDNVRFHNGSLLTAENVAAELNRIRVRSSELHRAPVNSISAVDERHIKITLASPYRPLGAILAHYSSAILAPEAYDADGKITALIGTGPFSAEDVSIPHKLMVKRYDDYWGQKATIEYASYLTGHRAEARTLQARSGQGDIVFGLDPASVPSLKQLPDLEIIRSDLPRTLVLKLNAGHPLLKDVEVRTALSLALNRAGIASAILHAPEAATDQLLPSYMADWHVPEAGKAFDLDKANVLMASQGWQKNANGILEKDGKPFHLTLITYADRPELTTIATAVQDQWKKLGVDLQVSITNSSAIPAGHQDGSLEVALIARNYGSIADPLGVIIKDFGKPTGGDWGSMNWSNPAIQKELNHMVAETDSAKYTQEAQDVAEAIYQEKPMIAIASYVQQTAVNKRLKGFHFDPYERSYYLNELSWR